MAGQSDLHLAMFSAPEVEFLAEDEMVEIVPNVRMGALHMICGDFGPFLPQIPLKVPLWLAVAMKKRGKCAIRPPGWLSVDNLTQVLEAERESPREFQALPFHYVEISRLLFDHARDDIPDMYMVRSLIEDIKDVRFHKVETGLETISGRTHAVKLKNLSAMEVNIVRPFLVRTLQAFYKQDSPQIIEQQGSLNIKRPAAADRGPRFRVPIRGQILENGGKTIEFSRGRTDRLRIMEQRVRDFLRPTKEAEERVASLDVVPQRPGVSPSFYEAFSTRGTRVDSVEHGVVRYSVRVAPGYTDADGNLSSGAIASLVDELGGVALFTLGHHTKVSVNISVAYLSTAKLDEELEITARLLGHQGAYSGTAITLKNKRTGEIVAEGRHGLFGKLYSNI